MTHRRIVIAGGNGHLGRILTAHFRKRGDQVIILTRQDWNLNAIDGSDIVINLAGRSVNCRYTPANRKLILDSRVETTRAIGEAIQQAKHPPTLWLNSSTATIYRHALDKAMDEETGEIGGNEPDAPVAWRFSIDVAKAWEKAFFTAEVPCTRRIALRSAVVMSKTPGGPFALLGKLVHLGLGGTAGSGNQFISWIHEADWIRALEFLMDRKDIDGCVNLSAPNPLPNRDFMRELRRASGIPIGLPAPELILAAAAFFMRTETELILKSRRVVPTRLLEAGFVFKYPDWRDASAELVQ